VCSAIIGGAIQSAGELTLADTTLDSNTAEQSGGALHSTATGVLTAAKCRFTNNKVHSRCTSTKHYNINAVAACLLVLIA
jgi:predicted outer membrane repeat protein